MAKGRSGPGPVRAHYSRPERVLSDILQERLTFRSPSSSRTSNRTMGVPERTKGHPADREEWSRVPLLRRWNRVPDPINQRSRTILTGEGGATPSRFKHVIDAGDGRLRRLTPLELERLNGFPDDWTDTGMPDGRRAFMMGNALSSV